MNFAQLQTGQVFRTSPRTVDADEIVEFARRYDPQPFHVDAASVAARRWGGIISSGWMTCAIAMSLNVGLMSGGSNAIGSPGVEQIEWPQPVRPGDTLRLTVEVLDKRVSKSGKLGVIRWRWLLYNQHDAVVLRLVATGLFDIAN